MSASEVSEHDQQMNLTLRPVATPRVVDDVYTDDQYQRLLDVVQNQGPWPTIASHHFTDVDQMFASVAGVAPKDHGMTLDDIAGPHFRGFLAEHSVALYPELTDCLYNERFLDLAKDYWGAEYAKPTLMFFNISGPNTGLPAHLDAVTFRGIRYENAPVWLQNVMGTSGLFTDYVVKMAQIITWWYTGENGTFTYWPDGPLGQPQRVKQPLVNKGVLVQAESMFHRGDAVGPPDTPPVEGLKHRSMMGYNADLQAWQITTDDEVVHTYAPGETRFLVHWNAELYHDKDELKASMEHSDDLTIDQVVGTLIADMAKRGRKVAEPSDPLNDNDFIRALVDTYTLAPTTEWAGEVESA